jgi:uncharacterized protein
MFYCQVCQEYIWRLHARNALGFAPKAVGNWWDNQEEIDIVAVGEETLLVGECKWTTKPVGLDLLDALKAKAQRLPTPSANIRYALLARAGFTEEYSARPSRKKSCWLIWKRC